MRSQGARTLPVTATQSAANTQLVGGPVRVCGWSLTDGTAGNAVPVTGTQTAPGAGATITSTSLPNGEYTVEWTLVLAGTPGAGEVNNVALFIGATQIADSVNLGAVGTYAQANALAVITGGPLTLAAKAIGAGTAGAIYTVTFTVIPTTIAQATISDGSLAVAFASIVEGGIDTRWLSDDGIEISTCLKLQATIGTVSGVIWYYLESDYAEKVPVRERKA